MIDYMQLSTSKHFRPALAVVLLLYVMFFILMFTMTGNEPKLMESPLPAAEIPSDRETIETQAERTIIRDTEPPVAEPCLHHCAIRLIDGTPPAHSISPAIPPTFLRPLTVLSTLIAATQQTIDIVVSGNQFPPATAKGRPDELYTAAEYDILNRLWAAFVNQAIRVRIVHIDDAIAAKHPPFETLQCMNSFQDHASEIMRSTLWLVDGRHAYLGATHGIGVWVQDCEPLAGDWQSAAVAFGNETTVLGPHFDARHGRRIHWNGGSFVTDAFVALPQRQIVANNHNATTETENSDDLLAILSVIGRARQYVNVALRFEAGDEKYWAAVRSALEEAALRHHVVVRVLLSYWLNDNRAHDEFLRSLTMLSYLNPAVSIEMKRSFTVSYDDNDADEDVVRNPSTLSANHYICSEGGLYMGTANGAHGFGLSLQDADNATAANVMHTDLLALFERDWSGPMVQPVRTLRRRRIVRVANEAVPVPAEETKTG